MIYLTYYLTAHLLSIVLQAVQITEAMVKHLSGDDEEERKDYLKSILFLLDYGSMLPLAIAMFQKYREVCPDKIELLTSLAAGMRYQEHKVLLSVFVF